MRSVSCGVRMLTPSNGTSVPSRRAVGGRPTDRCKSLAPAATVACSNVTNVGSGLNIGLASRVARRPEEWLYLLMTIAIAAVYGFLFGSFLTVVVDRVPRGASIVSPGSACGNCGLRLGFRDLVPVFSWLALRGKCRRCRMDIGKEPLILELVTSLLFGLFAWKFGLDWALPAYCVLAAGSGGAQLDRPENKTTSPPDHLRHGS